MKETIRKLLIISCVDPFGKPYGGSIDVLERIKWSLRF